MKYRKFISVFAIFTLFLVVGCSDEDNSIAPAPMTKAMVKVVHASPDAPGVDLFVDDNIAGTNLTYPNNPGYLEVDSGTRNVKVNVTNSDQTVIEANLKSTFIGCRESLKVMRKKRFGSVVNIASIVGETGNAGQTNYSASKGGTIAMTKSFAIEAATSGIRFNTITPGFIATEMTDVLKDEVKDAFTAKIPMGRFGNPSEVADAVAFLLSDHSSYITGETLKVNGGMFM